MSPSKNFLKVMGAVSGCILSSTGLHAADINQVGNSSAATSYWNQSALWGSVPTSGNDYISVAGVTPNTNIYTINGTQWNQLNQSVQDTNSKTDGSVGASNVSSTFGGDHLVLKPSTTLNGKAAGGSTQTVNLVFDGGFYRGNSQTAGTTGTTLAGTIGFKTGTTVAAIGTGVSGNTVNVTWTFNLNSTITGVTGNLLQLTMNGANGTTGATGKSVLFNVNSDLSNYAGKLYLGISTAGVSVGVGPGSAFSITSNATFATIQLDTTGTNFRYNLGSGNVTFGSLYYGSGEGTFVAPGIYDMAQLNSLTGTSKFFGTGTITVVPEPSTTAVGVLGFLAVIVMLRRRRCAS